MIIGRKHHVRDTHRDTAPRNKIDRPSKRRTLVKIGVKSLFDFRSLSFTKPVATRRSLLDSTSNLVCQTKVRNEEFVKWYHVFLFCPCHVTCTTTTTIIIYVNLVTDKTPESLRRQDKERLRHPTGFR